jgi:retron-type reverse transcriptase
MFDTLCSWENLILAYRKASRGKRGRHDVARFEHHLEDNLAELRDELIAGRYRPRGYASFVVHEPKRRLISAADFRDRVVHHALCNVMEPLFERGFIAHTYANRRGKGTHRALDCVQHLARRFRFVLQCDVRQFFASLDHAILRDRFARRVTDLRTLAVIDLVLAGGAGVLDDAYDMTFFPGDDLFAALRPRGLPIGNLTSQFWANVYLDAFDYFVTRELGCRGYVRYVDDFLAFADDKATLWRWRERMAHRLAALRLTMHSGAHPRPVTEGIPFLGFVVFPERRRLKRRKGDHFSRRLRGLVRDYHAGRKPLNAVQASIRGWVNHVRYANTVGLRKATLRQAVLRPPPADPFAMPR